MKLLKILPLFVFILIILGGSVRVLGAGLACPDWPLCFGKIIPPMDPQIFAEWFHRLIASFVGVLTLIAAYIVFSSKDYRVRSGVWMGIALVLLLIQILLGGATVLEGLAAWTVVGHLIMGYAFFMATLMVALKSFETKPPAKMGAFGKKAHFVLLIVCTQIILGGLVSSNNAGLACPDFPTCFGSWFPALEGLVAYQYIHRVGAFVTFIVLVLLAMQCKKAGLSKVGRRMLSMAGLIVTMQILIGISSIYSFTTAMRIAHVALAISLFATVLITSYESKYCA
jgi:heme a synthase